MKRLIKLFGLMLLISCGQQENNPSQKAIEKVARVNTNETKITFHQVSGKGILLGDDIKLLDENFKAIKDITYFNEQIVSITAVSNQYHKAKPDDDYCQSFKYVRIKTNNLEGYVDGRKLYQVMKGDQNKKVKIDKNEVSLIATSYFGIGVMDDDGLTDCSIRTPVVFSDKSANYEGLVKMLKNKNYDDDYPYFELKADDGAGDEIVSIDKQADKYVLSIRRVFQEGGADLKVTIYKDENQKFVAEIIRYEHIKEEELRQQTKK